MGKVETLKDKNYAPKKLGDVCVLGLGKTGLVVSSYLLKRLGSRVDSLHVYAGEKKKFAMQSADKLLKDGASVSFDDKKINKTYDLCIVSPGIPPHAEIYKSAKKKCGELISEIEFAWRECSTNIKWLAITGTNGKTTTTSLLTHVLNHVNLHAVSVGNIGNVALEAVEQDEKKSKYMKTDFYVAELSSYQLHLCDKFSPFAAALLNISPDHIAWHGSFDNYKQDKYKIFNNTKHAIVNGDDQLISKEIDSVLKNLNVEDLIEIKHNDKIVCINYKNQEHNIIENDKLKIFGEHNYVNARVAASFCVLLDIDKSLIAKGLSSFEALEHRIEPCGIIAGVRMFNDSKATNTDACLKAISSFEPGKAIFLMGGHDKETKLDRLVEESYKNLKGVILYGEAKDRFYKAFESKKDLANPNFVIKQSENMKTAFKLALENSFPGDFVVLSPACSSFDEFENFEERGNAFKQLVDRCKQS